MKFISSALLLILSAAITQSAVTPAQSAPQTDCQIVKEAYKTAGGKGFNDCSQAEEFRITFVNGKVTKM